MPVWPVPSVLLFFDLLMAFSPYTVWSLVIKGIAGWITGVIAHGGGAKGRHIGRNIVACLIGAAWTLLGYLAAWTVVIGSFEAAVVSIPSSLMTYGVGILVAVPLAAVVRTALSKSGFLRR
ncbi:MAG: ECF transporter S component [Clostridia bacterium]|jgi:uncharacterized membrane protein